jgi:hypothetical protein
MFGTVSDIVRQTTEVYQSNALKKTSIKAVANRRVDYQVQKEEKL